MGNIRGINLANAIRLRVKRYPKDKPYVDFIAGISERQRGERSRHRKENERSLGSLKKVVCQTSTLQAYRRSHDSTTSHLQ